ncbi:MAG: transglutaminase family protein [Candidatus Limnocylindrales bacterium]
MRLAIRYLSRFRYPEFAWDSHNVLRACPTSDTFQRLLDYRLDVEPTAQVTTHIDAWGTRVDEIHVRDRHRELQVAARATVETNPRPDPRDSPTAAALGVEAFSQQSFRDDHWVYLQGTRHAGRPPSVVDQAQEAIRGRGGALEVVDAIHARVHESLAYRPGTTYIGQEIGAVLAGGTGVCQDFVHVGLAMFRAVGVPARYVSGYFYAVDGTEGAMPDDAEISVQTHAWVEVAIPGWGWWAIDPTNHLTAGERHVKIGHGRDYDDVLPLRGVYYGTSDQHLFVEVGMSRGELSALPPLAAMEQAQQQQQ